MNLTLGLIIKTATLMEFANATANTTASNTLDALTNPNLSSPSRNIIQDTASDIIVAHFFLAIAIIVLVILQGNITSHFITWHHISSYRIASQQIAWNDISLDRIKSYHRSYHTTPHHNITTRHDIRQPNTNRMPHVGITNKTNRKHELVIFMHKRHKKILRNRARIKEVRTLCMSILLGLSNARIVVGCFHFSPGLFVVIIAALLLYHFHTILYTCQHSLPSLTPFHHTSAQKQFLSSTDFEQTFSCRNDDLLAISYITLQIPVKAPFKPMKVRAQYLA